MCLFTVVFGAFGLVRPGSAVCRQVGFVLRLWCLVQPWAVLATWACAVVLSWFNSPIGEPWTGQLLTHLYVLAMCVFVCPWVHGGVV